MRCIVLVSKPFLDEGLATKPLHNFSEDIHSGFGMTHPPAPYGDKLKGNESGHIIPNILGGKNRKNNVFSEDRATNRGLHRIFDDKVNRNLDNQVALLRSCPPQILELEYTVFLKYDQNIIRSNQPNFPLRPTSFIILANFSNPRYSSQGIFNNPGKES